jgi:hypothetical protein
MQERPTYSSEECLILHESYERRLDSLEQRVMDHEQRFDTLQTPFFRRWWFWLQGWPWYDLNGTQQRRPWHRRR